MTKRILVAGVGNVFLGDDGFGTHVIDRLRGEPLPQGVRVEDFGIRGVHLSYELLNGYDTLILVDALPRGEAPGTVFVFEPDVSSLETEGGDGFMDAHGMDPVAVLRMLGTLGGSVDRVLVVGCEPADLDEGMGLSPAVEAAVDPAAAAVRELVTTEVEGAGVVTDRAHEGGGIQR